MLNAVFKKSFSSILELNSNNNTKIKLSLLHVAAIVQKIFKKLYIRWHEMTNKKYILHNLNLTTWMLRVVEFIDNSLKMTNVFQHEAFRDYFCQRQNESYTKNEINVKILNQREKRQIIQVQNELRENILQIVHVMIITMINVEDFKLYSIFNSNLIIVNEIVRFLKTNIWNFFVNYRNFFIILVENEQQLRLVVQETFKNNVFVYFMNMSLFHRLKLLNHFSIMLRI